MFKLFTRIALMCAVGVLMLQSSSADTFTAVASGSWTSSSTWSGGVAPPSNITNDEVIIGSGFTIDLDADLTIERSLLGSASLTVNGTLNSSSSGRSLTIVRGNLNGSGQIDLHHIVFATASTIGYTGNITADIIEYSLTSLITTAKFIINDSASILGGLTIDSDGSFTLQAGATLIINSGSLLTTGSGTLNLSNDYNIIYRGVAIAAGKELLGSGLGNLTIDVSGPSYVRLNNDVSVGKKLTILNGTLDLNNFKLTTNGDIEITDGSITSTNQSDIVLEGTGNYTSALKFSATGREVRNLTINRTSANTYVELGSDLTVYGILNLTSGYIKTGNYVLDIASSGSITGVSNTRYIAVGASGKLGMMITAGATSKEFPVGTEDDYMPVYLKLNTGGNGMMRVNTINQVYANGNSGTDLSSSEKLVKGTWNITGDVSTNLDLEVKVMWKGSMEVNSFDRTKAYISHYTNGSWDVDASASATAESNNMYSLTRRGVTSLSPFAVRQATSSGVADINQLNNLNVYPNPANETITLNNKETVIVEVMNDLGQLIQTIKLDPSSALNIEGLKPGNYYLKISSGDAMSVKKFIKL
jgi:hypothetical protein